MQQQSFGTLSANGNVTELSITHVGLVPGEQSVLKSVKKVGAYMWATACFNLLLKAGGFLLKATENKGQLQKIEINLILHK